MKVHSQITFDYSVKKTQVLKGSRFIQLRISHECPLTVTSPESCSRYKSEE